MAVKPISNYWPGTKILKSNNNAFNWQAKKEVLTDNKAWRQSVSGTFNESLKKSTFTIYSKAKPSK